jgi:hypothetical protein
MKRIIIITFATAISFGHIKAQFADFVSVSTNQQLIEDAVKDAFFIIRSPYQLKQKNTNEIFGWNGREYFGDSIYTCGVKAIDGYYHAVADLGFAQSRCYFKTYIGYYTTDKALHPWSYDNRYLSYAEKDFFTPIIAGSSYRELKEKSFKQLPSLISKKYTNYANIVYDVKDTIFGDEALQLYKESMPDKVWFVWLHSDVPLNNSNGKFFYTVYRKELPEVGADGLFMVNPPSVDGYLLAGICVVPVVSTVGMISFKFAGMICEHKGIWYMAPTQYSQPQVSNVRNITPDSELDGRQIPVSESGATKVKNKKK